MLFQYVLFLSTGVTSSSTSLNHSNSTQFSNTIELSSSHAGHTAVASHPFVNMYSSQDSAAPASRHSLVIMFLSQSHVTLSESHSSVKPTLRQSGGTLSSNYSPNTSTLSPLHATVSLYSSGYGVTPSSGQSGATLVAGHPFVTLSASQFSALLPSNLYNGTSSPSLFHGKLYSSQYGVILPSRQSQITQFSNKPLAASLASHPIVTLSTSKFQVTQSATLATLQETLINTKGFEGTMYSTLGTFHMLNTPLLSDKTILHSFHPDSKVDLTARKTTTSVLTGDAALSHFKTTMSVFNKSRITNSMLTLNYPSAQLKHDHTNTSDIGNSASLTSGTISQHYQSTDLSGTVLPINENNSQDNIVSSFNKSASIEPSLSMGEATPPSGNLKPNTVDTPQISADDSPNLAYPSNKDSSGSSTPNYSLDISSPHQRSLQMAQRISSSDTIHNQTKTTDATKFSFSKVSILRDHENRTLTIQSSYHLKSDVIILTGSSTPFVHDMFTNRLALASVQTWDGTILSTVRFTERATSTKLSSFLKTPGKRSSCYFLL